MSTPSQNTTIASRSTELRTLHFDLSHTRPGAVHTLHLGAKRYPLTGHDQESRARFRQATRVLAHVPDEKLTHYVEDLSFPSDSVQSFYITHPGEDPQALPRISLFSLHVPLATLERRDKSVQSGSLYASKAARFGSANGNPPLQPLREPDLANYHDLNEAAKVIVFHHPEIICLHPDTAAQALSLVENTRSFKDLVDGLNAQGRAQGPDSDDVGFSYGEYMLDKAGQRIPDHKGGFRWRYVHTRQTREAMKPVVQQALLAVRNDKTMEGKSFATVYGKHNVLNDDKSPKPRVRRAAQASNEPYTFKLDDADWRAGRRVTLEAQERKLKVNVENSYFRYLGIYVRYLHYDKSELVPLKLKDACPDYIPKKQDGEYTRYLGKVDDRARIMGIPIEDYAEVDPPFEFELPNKASAVDILCGGMGVGASEPEYEYAYYPGALLTGVLNLGIPTFFLAFGIGSDKLLQGEAKKLLKNLGLWIVETFVGLIDRSALNASGYAQDNMSTGWAWDIITSIIKDAPAEMIKLIEWAAEEEAEVAMEESVPLLGQIWEAISVVTTLAEITETVVGIGYSPWVIPARVTSTMNINVAIRPDKDNSTYPQSATQYKVVAHLTDSLKWDSGWLSLADSLNKQKPDPAKGRFLTHQFLNIPSGGQVEVSVQFIADNGWVAAYGTSGKVDNLVTANKDALELDFAITENKLPLTSSTQYKHKLKLGIGDDGAHVWLDGANGQPEPPPTATVKNIGGNGAVTLEEMGYAQITYNMHPVPNGSNVSVLGYSWRGKSPTLTDCGNGGAASTPLYTMQNIELGTASPDDLLKVLRCGFAPPVMVTYDLLAPANGGHFVVAMAGDEHYHVRKINLSSKGDINLDRLPSWGRFTSQKITRIAAHGSEFLLALSPDREMVEILRLPKTPYANDADAPYATQIGKQGELVGLLHGARAMALTRDGNTFLVLEEQNNRIQAFNTNGVPVKYFGDEVFVPLRQWPEDKEKDQHNDFALTLTYLDMSLEYGGHIYVLSYEGQGDKPDDYRLDIYTPTGEKLARTRGVAAAKLTVDHWRAVYTMNFELLIGANQRPEPSVSEWTTSG